MRSRSTDRRPGTLARRVAGAAALAAVGGGLLAAVVVVVLADAAIATAEARRLHDEADEILANVEALDGDEALSRTIEAERHDLAPAGLRLAVYRGGTLAGGDASLRLRPAGCTIHRGDRDLHVCVSRRGPWATVIAADEAPGLGWRVNTAILLGAVLLAAISGALASRSLAGWALGPLARLRARLGDAPMDEAVDLGADEGVGEIDALRSTLRALLDRRAEALRSARLFAAGAAHELRTPLTVLSGELELLAEEPSTAPVLGRVAGLRASTARIGALVERLLVLASVGAAQAMRHDAVELGNLLDDLQQRLPPEAAARLSVAQRGPAMVRGDESLLAVLCENAVGNALLHAQPTAVQVTLHESDGDVVLDVIDEGPGVPPSERARLFEPFQRGATGAAAPGAGLGLALVAQIARAHGGEASFLDAPQGLHLRVRLPRWTPRSPPGARRA
jgi:signal transduction histidine kinase